MDKVKSLGEPCNLRAFGPMAEPFSPQFFTCGRPGRSLGRSGAVCDETVECWVAGLPEATTLHLVSLLGTKEDETSEYSYYSFRSSYEHSGKPTFQAWLDLRYHPGRYRVHEYQTVDGGPGSLSTTDLDAIRAIIVPLIAAGETVVVFDSYGGERTGQVREALGFRS